MSTINLNIPPYYDDYTPESGFHQILFRPSYPVQARELTQSQTILQEQVRRFGNHIFKHGSVVVPGNSFAELNVPCVTVLPTFNSLALNAALFESQTIVGVTSGVVAVVKKVLPATDTEMITFYLSYISGGKDEFDAPNGLISLLPNETIYIQSQPSISATISNNTTPLYGSIAYVNKGVYYVNGTFVLTSEQSIVISRFTSTPSAHVLLKINQEIVDAGTDPTLLDPAQGSYNYAAPGADRLKISLELVTLPLGTAIAEDYIELMRYNEGVLEEHSRYPKYNELEKSLARRTYDESGDYVVAGFDVKVKEHNRIGTNGGVYIDGDSSKIVYTVNPGKAYIAGFGVDAITSKNITVNKCRSADHVKIETTKFKSTYGQYILIADFQGSLNVEFRETIRLYNTSEVGGTQIGTAKVMAVDYYTGDGSSSPIYKLYITDLSLGQYSLDDVGKFDNLTSSAAGKIVNEYLMPLNGQTIGYDEVISFNSGVRIAKVSFWNAEENKLYAHKHDSTKESPRAGETITSSVSGVVAIISAKTTIFSSGKAGTVFVLPKGSTKTLKNSLNDYDLKYTSNIKLTIASGNSSTTTTTGSLIPIEAGTFLAVSATGILPRSQFSITVGGNQITSSVVAPVGGITIYCQMLNANNAVRTKTATTVLNISKTAAVSVELNHADVFNITSITLNGLDVKNSYSLNSNATEYTYNLSKIVLNRGITVPSGVLIISYEYYLHGTGDYFSVDSYSSLGADYLDKIPSYVSTSGVSYNLRDCLDFRNTIGTSNNILVNDAIIETSVQRYMPRYDSVCLNKTGQVSVISGYPADVPKPPNIPNELYELERIFLPAYTDKISNVKQTRIGTTRYTMKDVANIDERINKLEDFSTLTAVENQIIRTNILDAKSGLDRFKTGYLVEDFTDPFLITNTLTSDLKITANSTDGMSAKLEMMTIPMRPFSADPSKFKNSGGLITLPYTETVFASVNTSSRITNLNPFLVIKWNGSMTLSPPNAIWIDVLDRPEIFQTINQIIEVLVWVPAPVAPVEPPRVVNEMTTVFGPNGFFTVPTFVNPVVNFSIDNNGVIRGPIEPPPPPPPPVEPWWNRW